MLHCSKVMTPLTAPAAPPPDGRVAVSGGGTVACTLRPMKWASFVSEEPCLDVAVQQCFGEINRALDGCQPDLLLLFASDHHADDYSAVPQEVRQYFASTRFLGCSGGGVVGGGREVEHSPALSMTAAVLPGVRIEPFHLDSDESDRLIEHAAGWHRRLDVDATSPAHFVLLADPFSCDARGLLASLDTVYPDSRKVGGLASGASRPGDNALFIDDEVWTEGVAGLMLNGDIAMDTIVAQGCRPIGPPLFITSAVRNRILELDGRRPTELLSELYEELSVADQKLFRHSLFIGVVMTEGRSEYSHGDFLVRNLVGVEPDTGVISVSELLEPGQVVQFHLRDADSSAEDLEMLLRDYKTRNGATPDGALLFSCLGRGETLYGQPDHDSRMINAQLGDIPIGGFFCNGEIGPVDRRTFVHGYTSSIALFRQQGG